MILKIIKSLGFLTLGLVLGLLYSSMSYSEQGEVALQIFFTSDVFGYLKPCG